MMQRTAPTLGYLGLILCSSTWLSGCGAGTTFVPVSGKVTTKAGEPCVGALVVFHPLEQDRVNDPKPVGTCDAEGRFVLTTQEPEDGAQPGGYGVTVVWITETTNEGKMTLFGESSGGRDRLQGRYGQPRDPKFSAVVAPDQSNSFEFIVE